MDFGTLLLLVVVVVLIVGSCMGAVSKKPGAPADSMEKQAGGHVASSSALAGGDVEGDSWDDDDYESYHFRQLGFGLENFSVAALGRDDD